MIKSLFINRSEQLKRLTHGLKQGKDYILIAPRRYGKTTLAEKILTQIHEDDTHLTLHLDIMRYSGSVQSLAEGIIESCLNALGFVGKLKLWLKQIEFSFKLKIQYADLAIEPLLQMIHQGDNENLLLEKSLQLIEKIAKKHNKKVIVFFDEFGELYALGEQVIKIFRSVIQLQKEVSYLFAGSQETLMQKIFVEKSGAFYRFGELVFLDTFDHDEVLTLLIQMNLSQEIIETILNTFKCHPYYTAKIIKDLIIEPHHGQSANDFLSYIEHELIPQENGYLELQLQKIKTKSHALDIFTLLSMNIDPYSHQTLNKQAIYSVLKNLEQNGFIRKLERSKYTVNDPLLNLYLNR